MLPRWQEVGKNNFQTCALLIKVNSVVVSSRVDDVTTTEIDERQRTSSGSRPIAVSALWEICVAEAIPTVL